ncbi:hypothetical protein HFQ13_10740 [Acidithiobacillus sp. VAN18-1]|uniref:Uncharacterized protein n=1 Tax=Igneacidithiobacillus copahuensis TaxID=2724909 RepID=A0AAE2YRF0_9PROT|nr:hypothetical protein [Igneacidithiobacillus copahuensis]
MKPRPKGKRCKSRTTAPFTRPERGFFMARKRTSRHQHQESFFPPVLWEKPVYPVDDGTICENCQRIRPTGEYTMWKSCCQIRFIRNLPKEFREAWLNRFAERFDPQTVQRTMEHFRQWLS